MSESKRTLRERIDEKDDQIEKKLQELKQLQAQKKKLESRKRSDDEKARVHRLIEVGATVESVLGRPIEHDELDKLLFFLKDQEERGKYFSKAMNLQNVENGENVETENYF